MNSNRLRFILSSFLSFFSLLLLWHFLLLLFGRLLFVLELLLCGNDLSEHCHKRSTIGHWIGGKEHVRNSMTLFIGENSLCAKHSRPAVNVCVRITLVCAAQKLSNRVVFFLHVKKYSIMFINLAKLNYNIINFAK